METNPTPSEVTESPSSVQIIPLTAKEFQVASGTTYYVENTLTVERYKAFEQLSIELAFSTNFADVFQQVRTAFDLMNASKPAEASVQLYRLMQGLVQVDEKQSMALYIAALFINTAEEDRSQWNIPQASAKLKDWAGCDVSFFLQLALSRVSGFAEAYRSVSQLFSESINAEVES